MAGYTALGASASVADFNGDGFDDLFVTDSAADGQNRLYRNNGDLTFTDVAAESGLGTGNDAANASADSLWFDVDNDGRPDLFVVRFGHSQLFLNLGSAAGSRTSRTRPVSTATRTRSRPWRSTTTMTATSTCSSAATSSRSTCSSRTRRGSSPRASRRRTTAAASWSTGTTAIGTFTDVTEKVGLKLSGWTLDLGHGDANGDGWDDLYVACDFGTDRFFVNNGDGTFRDATEKAIGIDTKKGMNAEWGDFDGDGLFDIFVTNITDDYMREGNFLWKNNGDLHVHRRVARDRHLQHRVGLGRQVLRLRQRRLARPLRDQRLGVGRARRTTSPTSSR